MSTGTWLPMIRCARKRDWTDTCVKSHVRTTTTTTTTTRLNQVCIHLLCVASWASPRAAMDVERDESGGAGSARRRRGATTPFDASHERMRVAMAVAEATHHSSRGEKNATAIKGGGGACYERSPMGTGGHPLPGCGQAVPLEPGPQRSDRTPAALLRDNTFLRGGARSCCG